MISLHEGYVIVSTKVKRATETSAKYHAFERLDTAIDGLARLCFEAGQIERAHLMRANAGLAADRAAIERLDPGETWMDLLVDARPYTVDGIWVNSLRAVVERRLDGDYIASFEVMSCDDWETSDEGDGLPEPVVLASAAEIPDALSTFRHMGRHWERRLARDAPIGAGTAARTVAA